MNSIPEISVQQLAARLQTNDQFVVLDVREPWELKSAAISDERLVVAPMSILAKKGLQGLPHAAQSQAAEVLVLCHHGNRSAQVTMWLASQGWSRTFSVAGGIDRYSKEIDSSVGSY